jgi:hypothetical protein
VIDVRIFTQVDILRISDGSRRVDPDIFLGMDVGPPDYLLVDVVGKTVEQRYKEFWRESVTNDLPNIFGHLVPPVRLAGRP